MATTYREAWLRSLAIDNITETWHLDVIQSQFIDAEARAMREDFISGFSLSGPIAPKVSAEDRLAIARAACAVLRRHGREPRVNVFWMPSLVSAPERRP